VRDPDVLWLIDRILKSGEGVLSEEYEMVWFPGDDPSTGSGQGLFAANRPRGLPIGVRRESVLSDCSMQNAC
jgi:RNA-directed DNA polymerase